MINLAVYNKEGKEIETVKVDEDVLGGEVRYPLLKQAIVMYHANKRVGTAATKGRGEVSGSTKKLFRQKGTGNARVGNARTGKRVGGGVTFAKKVRNFGKDMPKKQRKMATNSALLAKIKSENMIVIDQLSFDAPKTKDFATILKNLKIDRSCLVTTKEQDQNIYKSARNIFKVDVMPVSQLNAGDICNHMKMLVTKDALMSVLGSE
jgi:large subunit ribosomal protein L4